jgi:hypothetical protein
MIGIDFAEEFLVAFSWCRQLYVVDVACSVPAEIR